MNLNYHLYIVLTLTVRGGLCYTCSTPDTWLGIFPTGTSSLNLVKKELWPQGIVKYHLNASLSEDDKKQVFAAFEEYHTKTCIRFEKKQPNDDDYVSIERDDTICGIANVCKVGKYQFARFGGICGKTDTMIHELGHSLCLEHEHQRQDRDDYLDYTKMSCPEPDKNSKKQNANEAKGLYDYASQMHYECGNCVGGWPKQDVKGCGPQINSGLSVLDVDSINALYNCQGCYRHRWILINRLTDYKNILSVPGNLSICRASINGTVLIGSFHKTSRSCIVANRNGQHKFLKRFEVLTIPGGARLGQSEYMWSQVHEGKTAGDLNSIFKNAVVAGYLPWGNNSTVNGYVVYWEIKRFKKWCPDIPASSNDKTNLEIEGNAVVVGTVWRFPDDYTAFVALCGKRIQIKSYNVLVCKEGHSDKNNGHGISKFSENISHLESIDEELQPGSEIIILGQIHFNAEAVFFELCEEKFGGSIILRVDVQLGRPSHKNESTIVRNSYDVTTGWGHNETENTWGNSPFEQDDVLFTKYTHRLPFQLAKYLKVRGDVNVLYVYVKRDYIDSKSHKAKEGQNNLSVEKTTLPSKGPIKNHELKNSKSKDTKWSVPKTASKQQIEPSLNEGFKNNSNDGEVEEDFSLFVQLKVMVNANFMISILFLVVVILVVGIVIGIVVNRICSCNKATAAKNTQPLLDHHNPRPNQNSAVSKLL